MLHSDQWSQQDNSTVNEKGSHLGNSPQSRSSFPVTQEKKNLIKKALNVFYSQANAFSFISALCTAIAKKLSQKQMSHLCHSPVFHCPSANDLGCFLLGNTPIVIARWSLIFNN